MTLWRFRSILKCNPSQLHKPRRFFAFSFFLLSSTPEIGPKRTDVPTADHLLNKHQFSPETAFKVSSVVTHLKNPEKADSVISFLTASGFSKAQVEHVVKTLPKILCSELEPLKPKIKIFQDFDFSPTDTANILSADPWTLKNVSANQIKESLSLLGKILGSDFRRVIDRDGSWFLKRNIEKSLLPNVEYLKSCGISSSQMVIVFRHFPRMLALKPETFQKAVQKVDEMGVSRESKMFVYAVRAVSDMSVESWERKLQLFHSVGFTEDNIVCVFRRLPNVFSVSERKIKEIAMLLLGSGIYDISFIVNYPQIFIYSIERTIKPRLQVLKILKAKNLLILKVNLSVYLWSDEKFIQSYVIPFLDKASELSGM